MVANGSEPREVLLDPMIAGSRDADGCEFEVDPQLKGGHWAAVGTPL